MPNTEAVTEANVPINEAPNARNRKDPILDALRFLEKDLIPLQRFTVHLAVLTVILLSISKMGDMFENLDYQIHRYRKLADAYEPEGVCYEYCTTFTLSYPPSICNCVENATDIIEYDNKTLTSPARQYDAVSLFCQTKPMENIRKMMHYVCYVDVCENNFDPAQAKCSTCPGGSVCSSPSPAVTKLFSTLVTCVKEHLTDVCKNTN